MNWSEHNLESICKYSYNIFRIPVYLYESEKLISSIPTELMTYHPHEVLQNPISLVTQSHTIKPKTISSGEVFL